MPTTKRIHTPGAISHIMSRGIDGITLFRDDTDRYCFLDVLSKQLIGMKYICYGWVLMSNHYHLIVRTSEQPLDKLMRVINSNYAKYFNRRYSRHGYLFQDRFKSIVTQDQKYLEELIRYVHLNPLRAGICKNMDALDIYPWCGHSVIMGNCNSSFQEIHTVLRYFSVRIKTARKRYRQFIEGGIDTVDSDWLNSTIRKSKHSVERKDRPGSMVIGDRDFVLFVMEKNKERLGNQKILRQKWMINDVFTTVAQQHGLDPKELKYRSRSTAASLCRKKAAYICCWLVGYSVAEVGLYLNVSGPAVSWMIKKGEMLVDNNDIESFNVSSTIMRRCFSC